MDLTPKQRAVLQYLKRYRREHGMPPSYEEIRREFRFASLNSARKHLLQLDRKGFIRSPWGNQKRALEIVEPLEPPRAATLRVEQDGGGTVEVPQSMLREGEHFALRARGNAFASEGIVDGDLLVVQRRTDAGPGQMVVVLADGQAIVTRQEDGRNRPEGVVVGLIRTFP
jgi:repressor LexA